MFCQTLRRNILLSTTVRCFTSTTKTSSVSPPVLVERSGEIATIFINKLDVKNAVDLDTANALADALKEFDQDPTIKAGVLMGAGGTFCAGADLKAIYRGKYNRLEDDGDAPLGPSRFELSKPLIAAISGYAVAGGLELACLCDLRVMEEDAIVGVFCRRWGVPLIDGGTVRLPRLIGFSRAMDLVLTGRPVDATEAKEMGFANRVVAKGKSREVAEALAKEIISFPYECMLADRKSLYENMYGGEQNADFQGKLKTEFQRGKPIAQHLLKDGVTKFVNRKN
jgi:enoyl-CoA hydratase